MICMTYCSHMRFSVLLTRFGIQSTLVTRELPEESTFLKSQAGAVPKTTRQTRWATSRQQQTSPPHSPRYWWKATSRNRSIPMSLSRHLIPSCLRRNRLYVVATWWLIPCPSSDRIIEQVDSRTRLVRARDTRPIPFHCPSTTAQPET